MCTQVIVCCEDGEVRGYLPAEEELAGNLMDVQVYHRAIYLSYILPIIYPTSVAHKMPTSPTALLVADSLSDGSSSRSSSQSNSTCFCSKSLIFRRRFRHCASCTNSNRKCIYGEDVAMVQLRLPQLHGRCRCGVVWCQTIAELMPTSRH